MFPTHCPRIQTAAGDKREIVEDQNTPQLWLFHPHRPSPNFPSYPTVPLPPSSICMPFRPDRNPPPLYPTSIPALPLPLPFVALLSSLLLLLLLVMLLLSLWRLLLLLLLLLL